MAPMGVGPALTHVFSTLLKFWATTKKGRQLFFDKKVLLWLPM